MRRVVGFIFVFVVAFFFTACGGGGSSGSPIEPPTLPIAPVATFTSFSTNEDVNFTGTLTATDADTNLSDLSYSKVSDPSHGTVNVESNGSFTYSPTANYNGSDSFTYKVNDGNLSSADKNVTITVTSVNDAPIISGTPNTYISKTSQYVFTPTVSDVDNNSFTYSITNKPSWADFNTSTGTLSGTPSTEGTTTNINISVSDGNLSASLPPFNITVTAVNNTPVGINLSTYSVNENTTPEITISTEDNDSTVFVYSLAGGTDDANFTILGDKLSFIVTPNFEVKSLYSIKIQTKDDLNATFTKDFNITIVNQNDVATFTTTPSVTTIWQGESFNYVANIKDEDSGQTLTALTHTIPNGFDINATDGNNTNDMHISVRSLQTGDNMVGTHNFILNVRENNTSATIPQSFSVTIQDVNDAPSFLTTPSDVNISYGATLPLTFTIDDGDSKVIQTIDINATSSNLAVVPTPALSLTSLTPNTVNGSGTFTLTLTGLEPGESNITIYLKDGNGTLHDGDDNHSVTFKAKVRANGWKIYEDQKASIYTKNSVTFDDINYTWNSANRWYENNTSGTILMPVKVLATKDKSANMEPQVADGHYYVFKSNYINAGRKETGQHTINVTPYSSASGSDINASSDNFQHDPVHHLFVSKVVKKVANGGELINNNETYVNLVSDNNFSSPIDQNTSYGTDINSSNSYANATNIKIDKSNNGDDYCADIYGTGWRIPTSYEIGINTIQTGTRGYYGYIPGYVGTDSTVEIWSSSKDNTTGYPWTFFNDGGANTVVDFTNKTANIRCVYGIF